MSREEKDKKFIKRGKIFVLVMGLLCLMNIVILIGKNSSYALFRRNIQSKRIVEIHTAKEFPTLIDKLNTKLTSSTYVTDSDGTRFLSGTNDTINFNYVWYSGKLWRITAINADKTIKMITQDEITAITWGSDTTYQGSFIYQWLNEDFLDTLENHENIIVQNSKWNVTEDSNETPVKPTETTPPVESDVGLLSAYEYYQSYKNLGTVSDSAAYGSGYLNIGYYWWLITPYSANIRCVVNTGNYDNTSPSSGARGVRPSINLKSDIKISGGVGTKENPYRIEGDKSVAKVNDKLNSRASGEYVKFDNKLYRIVGTENKTTKLTSVDYVRDDSGAVITKKFGSNKNWATSVTSDSDDNYWSYYLNNTWYNSISVEYKNMLVQGTYYLGTVGDSSYKSSICSASNTTETTKDCDKTGSTWTGYVGLPREGEMFSAMLGNGYTDTTTIIWLISPHSATNGVRCVISDGRLAKPNYTTTTVGVRPSINLKSDILISGGEGTLESPYQIKSS